VSTFPTAAGAAGEQLGLSLGGTLQGRYDAWRRTSEGLLAFLEIERRVLARANSGSREQPVERIAVNEITELVRRDLRVRINNSWRALISRELIARTPWLKDLIEIRRRRAA